MKNLIYLLFAILTLTSCEIENTSQSPTDWLSYELPQDASHSVDIINFQKKAAIGKKLYFTKVNGVACSDCHGPKFGFTAGQMQSGGRGFSGPVGKRVLVNPTDKDAPPVKSPSSIGAIGRKMMLSSGAASGLPVNIDYSQDTTKLTRFNLWGEHAAILQVMFANQAHQMVDFQRDSLMLADTTLLADFRAAYPGVVDDRLCEIEDIAECIAAFQMGLIPNNSRFQKWLREESGVTMDSMEIAGLIFFDKNCAYCHVPPFLGHDSFHDVGFPHMVNEIHDGTHPANTGRYSLTKNPADSLKFLIPNLNTNLPLHRTYGHGSNLDLDGAIQGHTGVFVSDADADAVKAFLNTTIDSTLMEIEL